MSPQHDFIIDNSTGANVRADINSVLQAIASNNSGSSAPSTTYALQSFANTTDSMLQLRNAANNAFVNLRKFDGTLPLPDGSASSPSLFFDDDTNTGIFSSAADTLNFTTGGVERMELGATTIFNESGADVDFRIEGDTEANLFFVDAGNNRVGIGTSSPQSELVVRGSNPQFTLEPTSDTQSCRLQFCTTDGTIKSTIQSGGSLDSALRIVQGSSEVLRVDTSGRLLIGGTDATNPAGESDYQGLKIKGTKPYLIFQEDDRSGEDQHGFVAHTTGALFVAKMAGRIGFSTSASGAPTEKMTLDSSGRLGIGLTNPSQILHLSAANPFLEIQGTASSSGDTGIFLNANGNHWLMRADNNSSGNTFSIKSGDTSSSTHRFMIFNDGSATIGPTSTGTTSEGWTFRPSNESTLFRDSGITFVVGGGQSGQKLIEFRQGGTGIGSISKSGTTGTQYLTSSDYRLKENAVDISDGITRLKTLKPYRFNFKAEPDKTVDGFFAHEVTTVPEAISGTKDEVDSDNNPVYQGIDQSKLVPLLVAAVQELIGKVEALEAA